MEESNADGEIRQRPPVNKSTAIELATKLFAFQVTDHQETKELESYNDRNFLLKGKLKATAEENLFILKVYNSDVSKFQDSLIINADIVPFVNTVNLECSIPQTSIYGTKHVLCRFNAASKCPENTVYNYGNNNLASKDSSGMFEVALGSILGEGKGNQGNDACSVQLLSFTHGDVLIDVQWTKHLLMDFGSKIAQVHGAFKRYSQANTWVASASLKPPNWPWIHLKTAQTIQRRSHAVTEPDRRTMVENIAMQFQIDVLHKLNSNEFQLVHGDMSCYNIITRVSNEGERKVIGLIDFGEKEFSHPLIDLGVAIAYNAIEANRKKYDVIQVASDMMAGYQSVAPLTESEIDIVFHATLGRIALSVVNGTYQHHLTPDNEYLLLTLKDGWEVLEKLKLAPKFDILKRWKRC